MALDELKDIDEKFEFDGFTVVVEKKLLESTGGMCIEFMQNSFGGGFRIVPKLPLDGAGDPGNACGGCSC